MDFTVRPNMSKLIVTALWSEDLATAFARMRKHQIRHLAVVNEKNVVVGIISDRDFQRAMQIDEADFFSARTPQAEFAENARVRDYMSWPPKSVDESLPLRDVTQYLIKEKISALLVTSNSEVVGIITTEDLLKVLALMLEVPTDRIIDRIVSIALNSPIGEVAMMASEAGF